MRMKFVILTGPTGSGKTRLSIDLAKLLNSEIISADSMQVYKGMDIGTSKITEAEKEGIKHHLIDVVEPNQTFNVQDFKENAFDIIKYLNKKNKIPLIVGGTGLYINSLIYDNNFTIAQRNDYIRNYYYNIAEKYGNEFLHKILMDIDPISAEKNHHNQLRRVIRALEVYDLTGQIFSFFNNYKKQYRSDADFKLVQLNPERSFLYENINNRVDQMLEIGLIEEVKKIMTIKDLSKEAKQAIGYKELVPYIEGELSLEEASDILKQNTRNYAKRQLTWFRKEERKILIDIFPEDDYDLIFNKVLLAIGD